MRRIKRQTLTQNTADKLAELTRDVVGSPDPKLQARIRWENKPTTAFREIRDSLEAMAWGRSRCMYCEDSLGTDIDHFWPKSTYPERAFEWANYLLACSYCNSNLKREEFPRDASGIPLLIDPTANGEDPAAHLEFLPSSGRFEAIGPKGPESIRVFGLNDDSTPRRLPKGRREALISLTALLMAYDRALDSNPTRANEIKTAIQDYPFSSVLCWLVRIVQLPIATANAVLGADIATLARLHRVETWL